MLCALRRRPPSDDPVKDQISVLQKQLLEVQKDQNGTRRKGDDRSTIVQALSIKVKTLKDQHTAPLPAPPIISKTTSTQRVAPEKRPAE